MKSIFIPLVFFLLSANFTFFFLVSSLSTKRNRHRSSLSLPLGQPISLTVDHYIHLDITFILANSSSASTTFSGEGKQSIPDDSNVTCQRSDDRSDHHKPLFPIPRRPEESPRSPLHNGVNRYAILHFRKIAILLFVFFVVYPVTVREQ